MESTEDKSSSYHSSDHDLFVMRRNADDHVRMSASIVVLDRIPPRKTKCATKMINPDCYVRQGDRHFKRLYSRKRIGINLIK